MSDIRSDFLVILQSRGLTSAQKERMLRTYEILGMFNDVKEFHGKMGLSNPPAYEPYCPGALARRELLIAEEYFELLEALDSGDPAKIVHESLDVVFVALGNIVALGINPAAAWEELCRANMAKEPELSSGSVRKPEGWIPADIAGAIADQV